MQPRKTVSEKIMGWLKGGIVILVFEFLLILYFTSYIHVIYSYKSFCYLFQKLIKTRSVLLYVLQRIKISSRITNLLFSAFCNTLDQFISKKWQWGFCWTKVWFILFCLIHDTYNLCRTLCTFVFTYISLRLTLFNPSSIMLTLLLLN